MRMLLVGYDLNRPGQDYPKLTQALKSYGTWWHHLDSTWLIRTGDTVTAVRDRLGALIDSGDELLVLDVTNSNWATKGLGKDAVDWLHSHL
jgi:hypothetical protein